jgi:large subunit ribosomal protein L19
MANSVAYGKQTIRIGDTVQIHYKLIEKETVAGKAKKEKHEETRERTQIFEGILIALKGSPESRMITVRKIGAGAIGIERIIPLASPWIKSITVKKHAKVRRAKLYYLRGKTGRQAEKLKERTRKSDLTENVVPVKEKKVGKKETSSTESPEVVKSASHDSSK